MFHFPRDSPDRIALRYLLQSHEKWKRRKRIPGVSLLLLQSKSEIALVDDPTNQSVDVRFKAVCEKQEVDAALSRQLDAAIRKAVRQINHPEEMLVSINQRVANGAGCEVALSVLLHRGVRRRAAGLRERSGPRRSRAAAGSGRRDRRDGAEY